jgi:hypothetical protein
VLNLKWIDVKVLYFYFDMWKRSLIVGFIIAVLPTFGQNIFYRTFTSGNGADVAQDIVETSDGGSLIVGWSENLHFKNAGLIIKVDSIGDLQWAKSYLGNQSSSFYKIIQSTDSNYIVAGLYESVDESSYFYLMKIDQLGDTLWTRTVGCGKETELTGLELNGDRIVLGGSTDCYTDTSSGINILNSTYLVMTDLNGMPLYGRGFSSEIGGEIGGYADGKGLCVSADSCIYQSGNIGGNNWDGFLIKLNYEGDTVWSRIFDYNGTTTTEYGKDVVIKNDSTVTFTATISAAQGVALIDINQDGDQAHTIYTDWTSSNLIYSGGIVIGTGWGFTLFNSDLKPRFYQEIDEYFRTNSALFDNNQITFTGTTGDPTWQIPGHIFLLQIDSNLTSSCNLPNPINSAEILGENIGNITKGCAYFDSVSTISQPIYIQDETLEFSQSSDCFETGIQNHLVNSEILVYPNPTLGNITLSTETRSDEMFFVQIFDRIGQLKMELSNYQIGDEISLENLTSGLYFISIENNQFKQTKKVFKL